MCECYQIGGPWIDFDPDCPEHGYAAQRRAQEAAEEQQANEDRFEELTVSLARLERMLTEQAERIAGLEDDNRDQQMDIRRLVGQVESLESEYRCLERQISHD